MEVKIGQERAVHAIAAVIGTAALHRAIPGFRPTMRSLHIPRRPGRTVEMELGGRGIAPVANQVTPARSGVGLSSQRKAQTEQNQQLSAENP